MYTPSCVHLSGKGVVIWHLLLLDARNDIGLKRLRESDGFQLSAQDALEIQGSVNHVHVAGPAEASKF